jgi:5-methylcytosine-specific restriction endonuclease McrA
MCNTHYVASTRHDGDPLGKAQPKPKLACSVDGCENVAIARGLCSMHWQRWRQHGDPLIVSSPSDTRNWQDCAQCGKRFAAKPSKQRQFCSTACYAAAKRIPDRTCPICGTTFHAYAAKLSVGQGKYCSARCSGIARRGPEFCSVEGCGRKHLANGFCRRHDPKSIEASYRGGQKRRARLLKAFVAHVSRDAIYVRDKGICQLCSTPVDRKSMTLDHIVPLALGGTHEPKNVRLAHKGCNSKRGIRYEGQLPLPLAPGKPKPEGHPKSKLTDAQALEAYQLRQDGWALADIAARYGIHPAVIGALCRGDRRQHLGLSRIVRKRIKPRV